MHALIISKDGQRQAIEIPHVEIEGTYATLGLTGSFGAAPEVEPATDDLERVMAERDELYDALNHTLDVLEQERAEVAFNAWERRGLQEVNSAYERVFKAFHAEADKAGVSRMALVLGALKGTGDMVQNQAREIDALQAQVNDYAARLNRLNEPKLAAIYKAAKGTLEALRRGEVVDSFSEAPQELARAIRVYEQS